MQVEEIMSFKLMQEDCDELGADSIGQAGSSCFAFAKQSGSIFVVGTEEGDIYKCSTAHSNEYIASYEGHDMNVYTVAVCSSFSARLLPALTSPLAQLAGAPGSLGFPTGCC